MCMWCNIGKRNYQLEDGQSTEDEISTLRAKIASTVQFTCDFIDVNETIRNIIWIKENSGVIAINGILSKMHFNESISILDTQCLEIVSVDSNLKYIRKKLKSNIYL